MTNATRPTAVLLAALTFGLAAPAGAQVVDASYRYSSKTEAILGAPSALAAIRAQQGGAPVQAAVLPAGRGPVIRPAVLTYSRQPVSANRPDVFNSVALPLDRTPLDARWRQVAGAQPTGLAAAFAASLREQSVIDKIEAVNSYVNARVRFTDDRVQFGVADRWLAVSDTLARGRGDCEDFALAKRALLRAAGVAEKDLYLVILKDLTRRADHAVLVVRANGRFLVLDNGTNRIVDSSDVQDYRPMLTFTAGHAYTHGYRREMPPMIYASNRIEGTVALADGGVEPAFGEDDDLPAVVRDTASLVPATVEI